MARLLKLLLALALLLSTDAAPTPTEEVQDEAGDAGTAEDDHTAQELTEAKEEFDSIDTNKDGFVTREEILEMEEVPAAPRSFDHSRSRHPGPAAVHPGFTAVTSHASPWPPHSVPSPLAS
jgi:hypothetical protein